MKSTMAEMKNTLNSTEGRLNISKEMICECEDRINLSKKIRKKLKI